MYEAGLFIFILVCLLVFLVAVFAVMTREPTEPKPHAYKRRDPWPHAPGDDIDTPPGAMDSDMDG